MRSLLADGELHARLSANARQWAQSHCCENMRKSWMTQLGKTQN